MCDASLFILLVFIILKEIFWRVILNHSQSSFLTTK